MRKTPLMMCCTAAVVFGLAACDANRTDDAAVVDPERDVVLDPTPVETGAAQTTGTTSTLADKLSVITGAVGSYLTDSAGRAVYVLENDTDGSACIDACLEAWPPVQVTAAEMQAMSATTDTTATGTAGTTGMVALDNDEVGTVQRADGTMQLTYGGHPLYHYTKDTGTGTTTGHGVEDEWGEWYLVGPDGEMIHDGA